MKVSLLISLILAFGICLLPAGCEKRIGEVSAEEAAEAVEEKAEEAAEAEEEAEEAAEEAEEAIEEADEAIDEAVGEAAEAVDEAVEEAEEAVEEAIERAEEAQEAKNPYQNEWNSLIAAIQANEAYNEVDSGIKTSLVTSMGRMAAHTGQEITYDDILNGDHIVGLSAPMVTTPATIIHSYQFMITNPDLTIEMYLTSAGTSSIEGPFPVILNGESSTLFQAGQSTGGPDVAVATVNLVDCVVGVEEASFGSVKSLFR